MAERKAHNGYEQIMATLKNEHVRFINLEFTDIVGMAKCVTIPVEQFADCVEHGKWFDGSALEGFVRMVESDMYLRPDPTTFAVLPEKVRPVSSIRRGSSDVQQSTNDVLARVICDVQTPDGERFDGDPRAALQQAIEVAQAMGYHYHVAPEARVLPVTLRRQVARPAATRPGELL